MRKVEKSFSAKQTDSSSRSVPQRREAAHQHHQPTGDTTLTHLSIISSVLSLYSLSTLNILGTETRRSLSVQPRREREQLMLSHHAGSTPVKVSSYFCAEQKWLFSQEVRVFSAIITETGTRILNQNNNVFSPSDT